MEETSFTKRPTTKKQKSPDSTLEFYSRARLSFLLLPTLLGLHPAPFPWKTYEKFRRVFSWIIFLLCLLPPFFVLGTTDLSHGVTFQLTESVCYFIFRVSAAISTGFFNYWSCTDAFGKLNQLVLDATGQKGFKRNRKYVNIITIVLGIIYSIMLILFIPMTILVHFTNLGVPARGTVDNVMKIFNYNLFAYLVSFVLNIYDAVAFASSCMLCLGISSFLVLEFQQINEDLESEKELSVDFLIKVAEKHEKLRTAAGQADRMLRFYVAAQICSSTLTLILASYALIVGEMDQFQKTFVTAWILIAVLNMVLILLRTSTINRLSRTPKTIISRRVLNKENFWNDDKLQQVVSWIDSRCEDPVGLTFGTFFFITKGAILTVASLAVTYVTLLIQMAPQANENNTTVTAANYSF